MSVEWINESDTELITTNVEDLDKVTVFRSKVGSGKTFYNNRVIMMFACKEPADDEVIKI